jgi:hypothetical protein
MEGLNSVHLTQDRENWQALVSTVMNLQTGLSRMTQIHGVVYFDVTSAHIVSLYSPLNDETKRPLKKHTSDY